MRRIACSLFCTVLLLGTRGETVVLPKDPLQAKADSIASAVRSLISLQDTIYVWASPVTTSSLPCSLLQVGFSFWTSSPSTIIWFDTGNRSHLREDYRQAIPNLFLAACRVIHKLRLAGLPPTIRLFALYPVGDGLRLILYDVRVPTKVIADAGVSDVSLRSRWIVVEDGQYLKTEGTPRWHTINLRRDTLEW